METKGNNSQQLQIKGNLYELWVKNGISHCKYLQGLIVDAGIARDMVAGRLMLSNGTTMPILVDARQGAYVMHSARKYLASNHAYKNVSAMAILIDHHVMKVLFNTLLRLRTSDVPARIFTNEQNALEWLEDYKEKKTGRLSSYISFL